MFILKHTQNIPIYFKKFMAFGGFVAPLLTIDFIFYNYLNKLD